MLRILTLLIAFGAAVSPSPTSADPDRLSLGASEALRASGFLRYLLPRFALKHGVRVALVSEAAEATLGDDGVAVFSGLGETWRLTHDGSAEAVEFQDWLLSEIGQRTIGSFADIAFTPPETEAVVPAAPTFDGDPVEGARLARQHCARCHVLGAADRMNGIGASPSFGVLRTLPDWENRFATFYVLKPHPAFTQIEDVTLPFAIHRPATIVPVEMTQDQVEAIAAYAATLPPADLGAPIEAR